MAEVRNFVNRRALRGPPPVIPVHVLVAAYMIGSFPMGTDRTDDHYMWVMPRERGILPLHKFHVPRRLRRTIRRNRFTASLNADFATVIRQCGSRRSTWINRTIIASYEQLHRAGFAHSIETYVSGRLAGGLYGVAIGGAFFGESMFSAEPMGSQTALIHLVAHLRKTGFRLLDIQFTSRHLERFGARAIPDAGFQTLLRRALQWNCALTSQPFESDSVSALQRISQIS